MFIVAMCWSGIPENGRLERTVRLLQII